MREIGAELKKRREELGLSLKDIQASTKIRMRYLEALEAGEPDLIPGEVFVKGFLRAYAGVIGLDGDLLVERYKTWRETAGPAPDMERTTVTRVPSRAANGETERAWGIVPPSGRPEKAVRSAARKARSRPTTRERLRQNRARRGSFGALGRVVFLAALGTIFYLLATVTGDSDRPVQIPDVSEPPASPRLPRDAAGAPDGPTTSDASPPSPEPESPGQKPPAVPAPTISQAVYASVYGRTVRYTVQNATALRVEAMVTGACWVRVSADGQFTYEGTLTDGASQVWQAASRLTIRAGRPSDLKLTVNGVAVSLPPDPNPVDLEFWTEPALP